MTTFRVFGTNRATAANLSYFRLELLKTLEKVLRPFVF